MDQTPHTPPDGLDSLLQKYLLDRNPTGPDGKPLLEAARRSALGVPPVVSPTSGREAEMLNRLKSRVAELPAPGPTAAVSGIRWALFTITTVAVVTTASLLFYFKPFNTRDAANDVNIMLAENNPHSLSQSGTQSAVAPWVSNTPLASEEDKDRSLLRSNQEQGNGSPDLNPGWGLSRKGTRGANSTNALQQPGEGQVMTVPAPLVTTPFAESPAPALDLFPLRNVFEDLLPDASFAASFDNDNGFLMQTKRGTLLHFPRGAFVTLSGAPVIGPVEVSVREAYNRSDFFKANLSGIPGEHPFINGGAIEINATFEGRPVMLASGKDVYVEFARNGATSTEEMRTFAGFRNQAGRMAWTSSGEVASRMIPLPTADMHFFQFWCRWSRDVNWRDLMDKLDDPRNPWQNTWVNTLEFRDRVRAAYDMGHASEVLKMYLDNTDKELWVVDQMVAQQIKANPATMGNQIHKSYHGEEKDGIVEGTVDASVFFRFAAQRKSTVYSYSVPKGVNMDVADAARQLEIAGLSSADANRLLRVHRLRQIFIQRVYLAAVENPRPRNADGPKYRDVSGMPDLSVSNAYQIRQLGWNLRGTPMITPAWRSTSLNINVKGETSGTRAWLVMDDASSMVEGIPTADGFYFGDIPSGTSAKVVVVGTAGSEPVAGTATLTTGKASTIDVTMTPTTMVKLDRELSKLD